MSQISPRVLTHSYGSGSSDSAATAHSLEDRLHDASRPPQELSAEPSSSDWINPIDWTDYTRQKRMQAIIDAMLMSQWKAQILSPDPDDPSACPTLQVDPSW
ncbi:hypothetical protein [Burkholderia latens]|uniref:hypothetical protein n=1 Tax=Burkholderia latens TaxID=488446 RepID=UPI00158C05AE|nr:hypothetical protein [Burkholderia latens]